MSSIEKIEKQKIKTNISENTSNEQYKYWKNIKDEMDNGTFAINDHNLMVKKSDIECAGLGVFSTKEYKKGDVIEIAIVLKLPSDEVYKNNCSPMLGDYVFSDSSGNDSVFVLGYGSLYNHSNDNNVKYKLYKNYMIYYARKNISSGSELYINYGSGWWQSREEKIKKIKE
jgi:uncharacterized protein